MTKLSAPKEKFAQLIASGLDQSDAYRKTHKVGEKTKPETIWQAASRLANDSKVLARIAELREPIIKKVQITLEEHIRELQGLRELAKGVAKYDAAIKAEMAIGKVSGLYVERVDLSSKDGSMSPRVAKDMTPQDAARAYQELMGK